LVNGYAPALIPESLRRPQPLARERMAGAGLKVGLEGQRLFLVREGGVGDQLPGLVLGRMGRLPAVVLQKPRPQVGRDADVALPVVSEALEQINVMQL
jgi:hypothetical protein